MPHDVTDLALADEGRLRIEWADRHMPVLRDIRARFEKERPLEGLKVAACLHVTTETANLMRTLKAGGASVVLCASNPLSTQDDTAAALVQHYGIDTFARRGVDTDGYYAHLESALDTRPNITMDDGCDLVTLLHTKRREQLAEIRAGTEETTTGVIRLRQMEREGALAYPIIAVNDTPTKHLFDNRYGTGQSTIDGILRATNLLLAGTTFVVAGFGYCGKGLAMRARGLGAKVVVTEVDPIRALEAAMEGFKVAPMAQAAREADVIVSVTGDRDVMRREHFEVMKDGVVIANSGHFDVEIDKGALADLATSVVRVRENVEEFTLEDGRRINLIAEGRLVNLGAAEGHPAAVMDMSFADQSLSLEWLSRRHDLEVRVHDVPAEIDAEVARVKLATMNIEIDTLTDAQESYLHSWTEGTNRAGRTRRIHRGGPRALPGAFLGTRGGQQRPDPGLSPPVGQRRRPGQIVPTAFHSRRRRGQPLALLIRRGHALQIDLRGDPGRWGWAQSGRQRVGQLQGQGRAWAWREARGPQQEGPHRLVLLVADPARVEGGDVVLQPGRGAKLTGAGEQGRCARAAPVPATRSPSRWLSLVNRMNTTARKPPG